MGCRLVFLGACESGSFPFRAVCRSHICGLWWELAWVQNALLAEAHVLPVIHLHHIVVLRLCVCLPWDGKHICWRGHLRQQIVNAADRQWGWVPEDGKEIPHGFGVSS